MWNTTTTHPTSGFVTYNLLTNSLEDVVGVYEYIIYTFDEEGDFYLIDEGKIYAEGEIQAKEQVLFDFAKCDEEGFELDDIVVEVRKF